MKGVRLCMCVRVCSPPRPPRTASALSLSPLLSFRALPFFTGGGRDRICKRQDKRRTQASNSGGMRRYLDLQSSKEAQMSTKVRPWRTASKSIITSFMRSMSSCNSRPISFKNKRLRSRVRGSKVLTKLVPPTPPLPGGRSELSNCECVGMLQLAVCPDTVFSCSATSQRNIASKRTRVK